VFYRVYVTYSCVITSPKSVVIVAISVSRPFKFNLSTIVFGAFELAKTFFAKSDQNGLVFKKRFLLTLLQAGLKIY